VGEEVSPQIPKKKIAANFSWKNTRTKKPEFLESSGKIARRSGNPRVSVCVNALAMQEHPVLGELIQTAYFASYKHRKQKRKDADGTPYINHPIGVAHLLVEAGVTDLEVLQAALLHDTVEDTATTFEELEGKFGVSVARIVREVSDDKALAKDVRKRLQVEHAPHSSSKAKLVKLADKLHNLQDLLTSPPQSWRPERIQGYFLWAHAVVEGLRGTNRGLEERLDDLFSKTLTHQGKEYPVLVPLEQREEFLESYYENMVACAE
jgi:guanosine-3',5'-bis(diphosphate) 3'-pyrophosphohydrolase